jgi:hypothetical protein
MTSKDKHATVVTQRVLVSSAYGKLKESQRLYKGSQARRLASINPN